MIEMQGLTKTFGSFEAVKQLDLQVPKGSLFAFLGPNGAGKSTTIRMLMGLLVPTSGFARIAGFDCSRDRIEVMRRAGFLPENPGFYDYLRGREILSFVGEMHGLSRLKAASRADDLLVEWGLEEAGEEFAVNYSMGMKKKLGLACAMVHLPEVLILDEPTNGLDPRTSRFVQKKLQELVAEGRTVFLSTHLLEMVEKICSSVCIIHQGALLAHGNIDDLRQRFLPSGSLEEVFLAITSSQEQA